MIPAQQTNGSENSVNVSAEELAFLKSKLAQYAANSQVNFGVKETGADAYQAGKDNLAAKAQQAKPGLKATLLIVS